MRHKIAFKLSLAFFAALLLFALLMGGLFYTLFRKYSFDAKKAQMHAQADAIAAAYAGDMAGSAPATPGRGMGQRGGMGPSLRMLDDLTSGNAWVVDANLQLLTSGRGQRSYAYADLPQDAEQVVERVFQGEHVFSEGFSALLATPTLTVGAPIEADGRVIGAVLLHAPVEGVQEATAGGTNILLLSMGVGLVASALLSWLSAGWLARPLKRMRGTAQALAAGDYTARTGIRQSDEIGDLAGAIDTLSVRLEDARQEGDKLERMRRDFVANISHELRTPVTVIRGSLEALRDSIVSQPEKVAAYHEQMLAESRGLERLVNDLLDLSRLQNLDFRIDMEELNLTELLPDVARSAGRLAADKGIDIDLRMDQPLLPIQGDYARLRQMLLIILGNAVKFSPPGGRVSVALTDGTVTIADQGPGIAPEDLPHIFDRFYKTSGGANPEGSGLGLAIARQIAQRHGIELTADNAPEGGAVFKLVF